MASTMSKKYPLLIVTDNLEVGGAEKHAVIIANELRARGHRVVVLANRGPFRAQFHPGVRFVRGYFEHGILGVLYGAVQIILISLQEGIELVHAQKLESSQAAWLATLFTSVPVVKTAHGYTRKELLTLGKVMNRYADAVVTVVDWLVDELRRNGVRHDKVSLIYNGMTPLGSLLSEGDRHELRVRLGISETDNVLLSVSRLERGKNRAELIEGFPAILAAVPDTKLLIVGDGPERKALKKRVQELGHEGSILFVNATTAVEPYLQIADVFVTPSVAQGMAVLEAMSAGLPVVGTKPGGAPEVVREGVTGFLVPKHDNAAFVSRIIELLKDKALRERFGKAGQEHMSANFSHAVMVDKLEKVYASVLRPSSR